MRSRLPLVIALFLFALVVAGCGGSRKNTLTNNYSATVTLVRTTTAPRTVTYEEPSSSMEPTIRCAKGPQSAIGCTGVATNDHVLVDVPAPQVRRYDIVVFKAPSEAALKCGMAGTFIKRVIGLPGDTVREDDHGFIWARASGTKTFWKLTEPYLSASSRFADSQHFGEKWHVPMGDYFMVGDNRALSCDSRTFGSVPQRNVIGKVVKIVHPNS